MPKLPWRFQADISHGETDPVVTVFMGELETDDDGNKSVRQDVRDPVQMRLSELAGINDLVDSKKLDGIRVARKEATKAEAAKSSRPLKIGA